MKNSYGICDVCVKNSCEICELIFPLGDPWLGHGLCEISRRSMAAFEVNVPSARNKHEDHVVPDGYGI